MSKFFFIPDSWEMSDSLIEWTLAKGLSEKTIENELESFRDHQYKRAMSRPDACWRNWIKNGILWGRIDTTKREYRRPQEITEEQRQIDARKGDENLRRLKEMTLKIVK